MYISSKNVRPLVLDCIFQQMLLISKQHQTLYLKTLLLISFLLNAPVPPFHFLCSSAQYCTEYIKTDELQSRRAHRKVVVLCRLQEGLSDLNVRLKLHEYDCVGMCARCGLVFVVPRTIRLSSLEVSESNSQADADCSFILQQQVYAQVCFSVIAGLEAGEIIP